MACLCVCFELVGIFFTVSSLINNLNKVFDKRLFYMYMKVIMLPYVCINIYVYHIYHHIYVFYIYTF